MQYFFDPIPVKDGKDKKWEFKCRTCSACVLSLFYDSHCKLIMYSRSIRRVSRTVTGADITFDDEPKLPKMSNVAGHVEQCKTKNAAAFAEKEKAANESTESLAGQFNIANSRKLMEDYLRRGELNPDIEPTAKGFRRLFAAWILDESLPWTMGEAPSLQLLFQYLKVKFVLPVDTSVRNELASIFAELHGKVVREFAVSIPLPKAHCIRPLTGINRKSNPKPHTQRIRGQQSRWFSHSRVP